MCAASAIAAEDQQPVSVGIIGIGAMGLPIARNLKRRGGAPFVRDIDAGAVRKAAAAGLVACDSAACLARKCDVVIVVVVDAGQIETVLFGEGDDPGVVHARRSVDAPRQTVILCSTIAPEDSAGFGVRLAGHGIDTIDGPISGGPARAERGEMTVIAAGERLVIGRCEALLKRMASRVFIVGERVGDGARAKLVNNLLAGINLVAGAEALALGAQLGLDTRVLFDVIQASSGSSWMFVDRMARALEGDFAPRARTRILTKDVELALRMAEAAGIAAPLAARALAVLQATVAGGMGEDDDASVIRTLNPSF